MCKMFETTTSKATGKAAPAFDATKLAAAAAKAQRQTPTVPTSKAA